MYLRLKSEELNVRIVIQKNTMTYQRPITGRFTASAAISDTAAWRRFADTLKRKSRGRVTVDLCCAMILKRSASLKETLWRGYYKGEVRT